MHRHQEVGSLAFSALIITLLLLGFQTAFAIFSGSISLWSDTGHVAGDIVAILLVFVAQKISERTDQKGDRIKNEDDYHTVELVVRAVNGGVLVVIALILSSQAVERIFNPQNVPGIIWVPGVIGLIVNIGLILMLKEEREHITMQSAIAHYFFDSLASVGVMLAGVLIIFTGEVIIDPLISLGIIAMILGWGFWLIVSSLKVYRVQNHT